MARRQPSPASRESEATHRPHKKARLSDSDREHRTADALVPKPHVSDSDERTSGHSLVELGGARIGSESSSSTRVRDHQGPEDSAATSCGSDQRTRLERLPMELLWRILVLSRHHELPKVSRILRRALNSAPASVKAEYLLARWFDSYRCGFRPPPQGSSPPESWLRDPESTYVWPCRMLPARADTPTGHASMRVLDYVLRYPICDEDVFMAVHDAVARRQDEFGNIIAATGDPRPVPDLKTPHARPRETRAFCLVVQELPKRLFREWTQRPTDDPTDPFWRSISLLGEPPYPKHLRLLVRLLVLHTGTAGLGADGTVPDRASFDRLTAAADSFGGYPLSKATFERATAVMWLLLLSGADVGLRGAFAVDVAIRAHWLEGVRLLIERDAAASNARNRVIRLLAATLVHGRWPLVDADAQALPRPQRSPVNGQPLPAPWPKLVKKSAEPSSDSTRDARGHHNDALLADAGVGNSRSFDAWVESVSRAAVPSSSAKRQRRSPRLRAGPATLRTAVSAGAWRIAGYLKDEQGVVPDMDTLRLLDAMGVAGKVGPRGRKQ